MLPTSLRVLLIISALLALVAVFNRIKKSKLMVEDSIFWIVCSVVLVLMAIFPDAIQQLAFSIGFMSAANFVYLAVIALLIWKVFTNSLEISRLKNKINELAQESGLAHMSSGALDKDAEGQSVSNKH